jgi:hypothetical protein
LNAPVPVRRRRSTSSVVTAGIAAVVGAALVVVLFLHLAQSPNVSSRLGPTVFVAGRATDLAREVALGGPLLFQDLLGRSRDIYVQHQGADPQAGWSAFDAHAPGAPRRCVLQWIGTTGEFRDPCSGQNFAADGAGLTRFRTSVDRQRRVVVDLRTAVP